MKKKTIRILAVASAAALLLGGAYLLTRDDIAQKIAENDLTPYMPSVIMQDALAYAPTESVTTTTGTSISEMTSEEGTTSSTTSETVPSVQENVLSPEICEELKEQAQEMQETYPDAIGWIYIPDTSINYPIMQGEDNDFYLTHGTDGRSLKCGCIELDFRCENRFQNNFNILYGHNMKNGSMFANVCRFKDKS